MEFLYFRTPNIPINVDKQDLYFGRNGEFSPEADISFEKHIKRLEKLNKSPMFKNMNGRRIKEISTTEPLKYWRV